MLKQVYCYRHRSSPKRKKKCFFWSVVTNNFTNQTKLKDMKKLQLKHCDGLRLAIIDSLKRRWNSYINLNDNADKAIITAYCHPRFKMHSLLSSLLKEKCVILF